MIRPTAIGTQSRCRYNFVAVSVLTLLAFGPASLAENVHVDYYPEVRSILLEAAEDARAIPEPERGKDLGKIVELSSRAGYLEARKATSIHPAAALRWE